jgi:hypothetical protein
MYSISLAYVAQQERVLNFIYMHSIIHYQKPNKNKTLFCLTLIKLNISRIQQRSIKIQFQTLPVTPYLSWYNITFKKFNIFSVVHVAKETLTNNKKKTKKKPPFATT